MGTGNWRPGGLRLHGRLGERSQAAGLCSQDSDGLGGKMQVAGDRRAFRGAALHQFWKLVTALQI
jgi:hypothetical protein